jgi:hypothetical protein
LAISLMGANTPDITQLLALLEAIPPMRGKVGRPRQRPERVQGDHAYNSNPHREKLRAGAIEPQLAQRSALGTTGGLVH